MKNFSTIAILAVCLSQLGLPALSIQDPPVVWPCNDQVQVAYDSRGAENRFTADLPGGAWNTSSALAEAAAFFHGRITCRQDCLPPIGCFKSINWTCDGVKYVSGPEGASGDEFTFTIKNFKVTGFCYQC